MNVTSALPALLVVDKNIRKDWLDLLVLYMETNVMNSSLHLAVSAMTNRIRPFVYHPDIASGLVVGAAMGFWYLIYIKRRKTRIYLIFLSLER